MTLGAKQHYPIDVFIQMLQTLEHLLDVAIDAAGPDAVDALTHARLAPDMFDLAQHVELTCRHALEAAGRLGAHPGDWALPASRGVAGLRQAVGEAVALLEAQITGIEPAAFEAPLIVQTTTGQRFRMSGWTMLNDWSIPQFYFHLTIAYAILRANGVQLGIRDYLGHMRQHLLPAGSETST